MRVNIETERLYIRNITVSDYQAAFKWCGDPVVNTYMIYPLYKRAEDLLGWLGNIDRDAPDECELVFVLKESREVIGGGGMHYKKDRGAWGIGYNLCHDHWGHGYAKEAMEAVIEYMRSIREVKAVEISFCVDNHNSKRIAEKLGFTYYEDTEYTKLDGSRVFPAKIYRRVYEE